MTTDARISNEPAVKEFVSKLNQRLRDTGMTPRTLAASAGVGFPYLYRVLKGEQVPTLEWASRVARQVGLEIRTVKVRKKRPVKKS